MTPFWSSFFDQLKHCGKRATLFLVVLPLVFVAALITNALAKNGVDKSVLYGVGGAFLAIVLALIAKAFIGSPRQPYQQRPLSDDERRVAVEKLRRVR